MTKLDDYPTATCPKCGQETADMDGFGFIACIPGCGYCTHPSKMEIDGFWTCQICGDGDVSAAPGDKP